MYQFKRKLAQAIAATLAGSVSSSRPSGRSPVAIEGLESRRLLSADFGRPFDGGFGGFGGFGPGDHGGPGGVDRTINFSQAPAAVQSGLKALATTDNVTAPTDTTTVYLGNFNGVESYTVDITGTGTDTRLTVDQSGKPVTASTRSTTTFGAVTNTAVTGEITKIASALNVTAPTTDTTVYVTTTADGATTYSVRLAAVSTTTTTTSTDDDGWHDHGGRGAVVTVDASGNPVGNQRIPLSTLPTAVQNGLTSNAPSGATALAQTDLIDVRTLNGVTTYTAHYTATGTQTQVTVGTDGKLTSLPSSSQVDFSAVPKAAQDELQALATADGAGTISSTQSVTKFDEANGTSIYTVSLTTTDTSTGTTNTFTVTVSSDQAGNPTVPPGGIFGGRGFGDFGGRGGFGGGCDGDSGTTTTTGSGGTTTGGTTTTTPTSALPAIAAATSSTGMPKGLADVVGTYSGTVTIKKVPTQYTIVVTSESTTGAISGTITLGTGDSATTFNFTGQVKGHAVTYTYTSGSSAVTVKGKVSKNLGAITGTLASGTGAARTRGRVALTRGS